MKMRINFHILIAFFTLVMSGCNNSNQAKDNTKETIQSDAEKDKTVSSNTVNGDELEPPDFADAELKQYYKDYSAYLIKGVTTIRNKDEAGTMKLFREQGKQFGNINEMEQKARATPEEEQKFTTWLMQAYPYQKEIIQSEYYKKFEKEDIKK
jgi:hypothetical protein